MSSGDPGQFARVYAAAQGVSHPTLTQEVQLQAPCRPRDRLEAIRLLRGYRTLNQVKEASGIGPVTVRKIEQSTRHVEPTKIVKYAAMLGLSPRSVDELRQGRLRLELKLVRNRGGK